MAEHRTTLKAGTAIMAAAGVGVGGYVVGQSMDSGRRPLPSSALASYSVIVPSLIGIAAGTFLWRKNESAAIGAIAGGILGALFGAFEFPRTPAGVAAGVNNLLDAERQVVARQQTAAASMMPAQFAPTPAAGGTASTQGPGGTPNMGQIPAISRYLGAGIPAGVQIALQNRFLPGVTPRIGALRTRRQRMRRMGMSRYLGGRGNPALSAAWRDSFV